MLYESSYYGISDLGDSLTHHGIKGQKWGVRRFQNPDGTLTPEGKRRYGTVENFNKSQKRKETAKKAVKIAATAAAIGGTVYLAKKYGLGSAAANLVKKYGLGSAAAKHLSEIRKMSDDDLLDKIGRLEKEKRVLDLERELKSAGKSKSRKILEDAGKKTAETVAAASALYGAKQGIKHVAKRRGIDSDKLIRDMFPKKK